MGWVGHFVTSCGWRAGAARQLVWRSSLAFYGARGAARTAAGEWAALCAPPPPARCLLQARQALQLLGALILTSTIALACRSQFPTSESVAAEVQKLKTEMFAGRIKFAKREEYKPAQYQELRQRVAQLLTINRERQILEGIDKREARAIEKRTLTEAGLGRF